MTTWDQLTDQAHRLLTRPRRSDLTPAVTLVQTLHPHPPQAPTPSAPISTPPPPCCPPLRAMPAAATPTRY